MTCATDLMARARAGWGEPPQWVVALAEHAMATSQRAVGDLIGYSGSVVSQAISNTYPGDIDRVAEKVRGALLQEEVTCPVLGPVRLNDCHAWQKKPRSTANSLNIRMFRACRSGCRHSRLTTEF